METQNGWVGVLPQAWTREVRRPSPCAAFCSSRWILRARAGWCVERGSSSYEHLHIDIIHIGAAKSRKQQQEQQQANTHSPRASPEHSAHSFAALELEAQSVQRASGVLQNQGNKGATLAPAAIHCSTFLRNINLFVIHQAL